jgi:hypothetical protein
VRLEGLGKLKKKIHLIGTRSRDLPACSIVPQPTTQLRASISYVYLLLFNSIPILIALRLRYNFKRARVCVCVCVCTLYTHTAKRQAVWAMGDIQQPQSPLPSVPHKASVFSVFFIEM